MGRMAAARVWHVKHSKSHEDWMSLCLVVMVRMKRRSLWGELAAPLVHSCSQGMCSPFARKPIKFFMGLPIVFISYLLSLLRIRRVDMTPLEVWASSPFVRKCRSARANSCIPATDFDRPLVLPRPFCVPCCASCVHAGDRRLLVPSVCAVRAVREGPCSQLRAAGRALRAHAVPRQR